MVAERSGVDQTRTDATTVQIALRAEDNPEGAEVAWWTMMRVLIAAFLGWLFDGFEIGLFPVVARPGLLSMGR